MQDLFVRPGESLTARLWNAFWTTRNRIRLLAGPNVRLFEREGGTLINFDVAATPWLHPWRATMSGNRMSFRFGLLDGVEPTINGVKISGDAKLGLPVPSLLLDDSMFDDEGLSYVCVSPIFDAKTGATKKAIIRQFAKFVPFGPEWPLVILSRSSNGPIDKFQHAFFHLRHWSKPGADKKLRHFYDAMP